MKKTKRYDDGGYTGDDPIVKYRMGMIDAQGNDLTKPAAEDMSMDREPNPTPTASTPKAVERTVVKTKVTPRITGDDTINPDVKMRSSVSEAKKAIGVGSLPKSFKEAGGNTTATKSKADMPSMKISLPDPLSKFNAKGQRTGGKDFELGVKKGGAIKKMASGGRTSASKRADGIATKGFTRG
jgi:hypothetical protein